MAFFQRFIWYYKSQEKQLGGSKVTTYPTIRPFPPLNDLFSTLNGLFPRIRLFGPFSLRKSLGKHPFLKKMPIKRGLRCKQQPRVRASAVP